MDHYIFIAIALMTLSTFATRVLPFLAFAKAREHPFLQFLSDRLPSVILPILVVYCLKDLDRKSQLPHAYGAIGIVVIAQLLFHRSLVSIFAGTICYIMLLKLNV